MNMHGLFTQTKHRTPHALPAAWNSLLAVAQLTEALDQYHSSPLSPQKLLTTF